MLNRIRSFLFPSERPCPLTFICNTINAINYEAIESGNYKVSTLLKKLSNTLRYTFDQKHQNVYMRQEIVWIEQYLYLQRERLESVFEYT